MSTPFVPDDLPLETLDYARLIGPVGEANAALARYDGLLQGLDSPEIMLAPLTLQEAVFSSRIEGTQATLGDVLEFEAGAAKSSAQEQDIREISNYRMATMLGRDYLRERPISLFLVRQLHDTLLTGTRGNEKSPGHFRKEQNWIGRPGSPIEQASYVPPSPFILIDHLEAWERYLAYKERDRLVQTAIVHAQFELIHPFLDGNGRIGRLLIPLFLHQVGVLVEPTFYLAGYLEAHRDEYYARLNAISSEGDWDGWIEFFLRAIIEQAESNSKIVYEIRALHSDLQRQVREATHSQFTADILKGLFGRPIFTIADFAQRTEIGRPTAQSLIQKMKAAGILQTLLPGQGRRAEILVFPRLINIVEGREVFATS